MLLGLNRKVLIIAKIKEPNPNPQMTIPEIIPLDNG